MAIITTAQYKAYAGISGTALDARLDVLIPCLQDEVEIYCGRRFDTATFTELVDGTGIDELLVRNAPIKSITSITLLYPDATTAAYASTAFSFSLRDDGRVWLLGSSQMRAGLDEDGNPRQPSFGDSIAFPVGRENVQVIYVGGYGTGTIAMPPSLQLAMYKGIDEYIAQTRQDTNLTSETLGKYAYTRAAPQAGAAVGIFSPQQLARFNAWKRVNL